MPRLHLVGGARGPPGRGTGKLRRQLPLEALVSGEREGFRGGVAARGGSALRRRRGGPGTLDEGRVMIYTGAGGEGTAGGGAQTWGRWEHGPVRGPRSRTAKLRRPRAGPRRGGRRL